VLTPQAPDKLTPVDIAQVRLSGLLGRYVASVPQRLTNGQGEAYLGVFEPPTDTGLWRAENAGKWLEAACNTWKYAHDEGLRRTMDSYAARLMALQQQDGWLGNYVPEVRFHKVDWNGLGLTAGQFPGKDGENFFFDVWNHVVTMLGLIRYSETTGDRRALDAACRISDLFVATFGDGKQDIMAINWDWGQNPGTVIYGMARLYGMTGERRYLDFCRYVMRRYGEKDTVPIYLTDARASAYPFGEWAHILKHCEFELHLMGLCELHRLTGDKAALVTCENVYDGHYAPQMATLCLHGFKAPPPGVRVPNTYYDNLETCDVPTIIRWFVELARLTGEARYLDAVEWNLYNALLPRSLPDGAVVPFPGEVKAALGVDAVKSTHDIWHCCYSMLPVGLSYIPAWCYFSVPGGILVSLYEPSTLATEVGGVRVRIEQHTRYPVEGAVELSVDPEAPATFDLLLRIPGWCRKAEVLVNGRSIGGPGPTPGSLARVRREWHKGDRVSLALDMPARLVRREYAGNPVRRCLTVVRGPLILALPGRLNPGVDLDSVGLQAESDGTVRVEAIDVKDPSGLGSIGFRGTGLLAAQGAGRKAGTTFPVVLVPYAGAGAGTGDKLRVEFDS
jgi:uncharacterized protein